MTASENRSSQDSGVEEQILLRVPPEVAKNIRKMMKNNNLDGVEFYFTEERRGKFVIGGQEYNMTLCDLPCVVETHKTLDSRSYYKSGDIGQILLVEDPKAPPPKKPLYDENFRLLDAGVTPSTRNIRQRKFRKRPNIPRSEIQEAEEEILRIVKNQPSVQKEQIELVKDEAALKRFIHAAKSGGKKSRNRKQGDDTQGPDIEK